MFATLHSPLTGRTRLSIRPPHPPSSQLAAGRRSSCAALSIARASASSFLRLASARDDSARPGNLVAIVAAVAGSGARSSNVTPNRPFARVTYPGASNAVRSAFVVSDVANRARVASAFRRAPPSRF